LAGLLLFVGGQRLQISLNAGSASARATTGQAQSVPTLFAGLCAGKLEPAGSSPQEDLFAAMQTSLQMPRGIHYSPGRGCMSANALRAAAQSVRFDAAGNDK